MTAVTTFAKIFAAICLIASLAACDSDSGVQSPDKMEVASIDKLGKCSSTSEGDSVFVKDQKKVCICQKGEWKFADGSSVLPHKDVKDSTFADSSSTHPHEDIKDSTFTDSSSVLPHEDGKDSTLTNIEKDTYGEMCSASDIGRIINGKETTTTKYYCTSDGWMSLTDWNWTIPKDARLNLDILYETMTDSRDKKTYKIVSIISKKTGYSKVWMAENLNYSTKNSWCYNNYSEYCEKTGRLYTWSASIDSINLSKAPDNPLNCGYGKICDLQNDVQGACPPGWHLPNVTEWNDLFSAVGGQSIAGHILKSQSGWSNTYNNNGTDAVGFSALPAGLRDNVMGFSFNGIGYYTYFWSVSEYNGNYAYYTSLSHTDEKAFLNYSFKYNAFSIRCIQN